MTREELDIWVLASRFRKAIDAAKQAGEFKNDIAFKLFPTRCCGDTCYLLAEFLLEHGIYTEYVEGQKGKQSHAWLVLSDEQILTNKRDRLAKERNCIRNQDETVLFSYQAVIDAINDGTIFNHIYVKPDYRKEIGERLVIDITGDQFSKKKRYLNYDIPVYVGKMDELHDLFEILNVHECNGLRDIATMNVYRMEYLYYEIKRYIE